MLVNRRHEAGRARLHPAQTPACGPATPRGSAAPSHSAAPSSSRCGAADPAAPAPSTPDTGSDSRGRVGARPRSIGCPACRPPMFWRCRDRTPGSVRNRGLPPNDPCRSCCFSPHDEAIQLRQPLMERAVERTRASRYCQDPLRFPARPMGQRVRWKRGRLANHRWISVVEDQVDAVNRGGGRCFSSRWRRLLPFEQPQRLTFGKGVGVRAVVGRGYEDSQVRSLAHDRSVEIPDGIDATNLFTKLQ